MAAVSSGVKTSTAVALVEPVVTLSLYGELGDLELAELGRELFRLMHRGETRVVLDFAQVAHLNYRKIPALAARADLFRKAGGDIKICGLSRYLQAIFRAAGAHQSFEFLSTRPEAVSAFAQAKVGAGL